MTDEHRRALAGTLEQIGPRELGCCLVRLEVAMDPEPTGVHHPLGNAFMVEVEDLLAEMEVLEQRRTAVADLQRVLIVGDGDPLLRRQPHAALAHRLMSLATVADVDRHTRRCRRRDLS